MGLEIWAEYAQMLNPEQWVQVRLINHWSASEDFGCCQVKDLAVVIGDEAPLEDFILKLCEGCDVAAD
ncbi:MAG: hypothetical protein WA902_24580 [Thermosynechococcaceae cyanobacterium]